MGRGGGGLADEPPFFSSSLFNVTNESPFTNSQVIGKSKEKSTNRNISGKSQFYPAKTDNGPPHTPLQTAKSELFTVQCDK